MATGSRQVYSHGRRAALAALLALAPAPAFAQPAQPRLLPTEMTADPGKRAIAYIYNGAAVTREELGDYLIARGGMEKLDLLVNKDIIEFEAARQKLTVTPLEIEAAINEDMASNGLTREQFVQNIPSRYGKTLYEWEQDITRPRLLLTKLAQHRAKPTEDDLKKAFTAKYGERREPRVIVWPKGPDQLTPAKMAEALARSEVFDELARTQPNALAQSEGKALPVGRGQGLDPTVEDTVFALKEGEARWVESATTQTCVKCIKVLPPDPAANFDQARPALEKEVRERKLVAAVGEVLKEIKAAASPVYTTHVPLPKAQDPNAPTPARVSHPDPRVLALIYKDVPVTRTDLGEFLIARGGYDKVELVVNQRIIEREAAKRNLTAAPQEVEAVLVSDLKSFGLYREGPGVSPEDALKLMKHDFEKQVLSRRGKTMFEWTEDVIKPRILLGKMCRDQVRVTDDDVRKAFESQYGEKRQAKIIMWAKDEFRLAQKQWDEARKGDAEFDRVARGQKDPNLAAGEGRVKPIGRYMDGQSPLLERTLFGYRNESGKDVEGLKVGDVSGLMETPAGIMCVKCVGVVPPAPGAVLDDALTARLRAEVFERKLAARIPEFFADLRREATPNVILRGPPSAEENAAGVQHLIQRVSGMTTAPAAGRDQK